MTSTALASATGLVVLSLLVVVQGSFEDNSLSGRPNARVCGKSPLREADGTQQPDKGTCSKTQLGEIPSTEHMTSTLILKPQNGATLKAGESFEVVIKLIDLETGFFSDPDNEYYAFSQQLNNDGVIKGHSHIVIQKLRSKDSPPDATDFEFFKGLNQADGGDGKLFQTVDGLSPGKYRLCTMASSFAHSSLIMPVAQRGPQDDCIRFNVKS
ncbi:hypothetical protein Mapa_009283 [Marchantia paleacea]|nr:hypothetical protein Mapa_009283 [Marchantia paleacea]